VNKSHSWTFIEEDLGKRVKNDTYRSLSPVIPTDDPVIVKKDGRTLVNFCSNDYLGLSKSKEVKKRVRECTVSHGAGSTASRLVCGSFDLHHQIEDKIASLFDAEAALLFNSGFQANCTIIGTLLDRHALVLTDKLGHNSILQGALQSRASFQRFEHNDLDHIGQLLTRAKRKSYSRILIVTESVFSMDGDRADLEALIDMSREFNTMLFVDEAHAVGVWGSGGRGLAYGKKGIDLVLGTCGKAFGSFGAFVTCSEQLKKYLVNFCPGVIYSTALPPPVLGAIDTALDLIPGMDEERRKLHKNIEYLRNELHSMGFDTGGSTTQILPIILGDEQSALSLSKHLENEGIMATAIRPPTVPESGSRIRITVTGYHKKKHLNHLLKAVNGWDGI